MDITHMKNFGIRLNLMLIRGKKIKEVTKYLKFSDYLEFVDYRTKLYSYLFSKNWQRNYMSANQVIRKNTALTPLFVIESHI